MDSPIGTQVSDRPPVKKSSCVDADEPTRLPM
jgi:hypothetical protein